jgi:hypothetical protein
LPILCRGVVHAIEEFEELAVGNDRGIKGHLEGFGVCRGKDTVSSSDRDSIRSPADCSWGAGIYYYLRPVLPEHTARYEGDEVAPPQ